jgi:hypothetical protein
MGRVALLASVGAIWTANSSSLWAGNDPFEESAETASADGPQPAAKPDDLSTVPLESLLERALQRNSDVRAAQVALMEAQVGMERARQELVRDIAAARTALERQRLQVEMADIRIQDLASANKSGNGSVRSFQIKEAQSALRVELTKMRDLEEQLKYLVGGTNVNPRAVAWTETSLLPGTTATRPQPDARSVQSPIVPLADPATAEMREKLIGRMGTKLTLDFVETPMAEVFEYLSDLIGIRFVADQNVLAGELETPLTIRTDEVALPAALTAVQDQWMGLELVVRPYGILLTLAGNEPADSINVNQLFRDWYQRNASPDSNK